MPLTETDFNKLWDNHPYPTKPCNGDTFINQCAIRFGVALELSGFDTSSFDQMFHKRRCWYAHDNGAKHILAAHELAKWINANPAIFGVRKLLKSDSERKSIVAGSQGMSDPGKKGIVYIDNGWGTTDHIDLWDGAYMRAGDVSYLSRGTALWFWEAK